MMDFRFFAAFLLSIGLSAAAATPAALSLSGRDWWLHADQAGTGEEQRLFTASVPAEGWIPAEVPGNMQADLEAAHQLTPLWYGVGDARMHEAACKDWWYRKDVAVPAAFAGQRVTLVFDGVDHECEVFLNGQKIGRFVARPSTAKALTSGLTVGLT